MKQFIIYIILIGTAITSYAQTFQVTDIVFNERTPEARIQLKKNQMLGQQIQINVFDKDIQIQTLDKVGKPDGKPYTMQRQTDGTYTFKRDATINPNHPYIYTYRLTVDKIMGYYRSLKIDVWENQDYLWTLTLKRK
ncbi:MAG: hypothetical protein HDR74_05360 [Bacteroides sp.]|nr:hypothetical protein [Bacteroides sp.]